MSADKAISEILDELDAYPPLRSVLEVAGHGYREHLIEAIGSAIERHVLDRELSDDALPVVHPIVAPGIPGRRGPTTRWEGPALTVYLGVSDSVWTVSAYRDDDSALGRSEIDGTRSFRSEERAREYARELAAKLGFHAADLE